MNATFVLAIEVLWICNKSPMKANQSTEHTAALLSLVLMLHVAWKIILESLVFLNAPGSTFWVSLAQDLPHLTTSSTQGSKFLETEGGMAFDGVKEDAESRKRMERIQWDLEDLTKSKKASQQNRVPTKQATASDFIPKKTEPLSLETSTKKVVTSEFCVQRDCC